MHPTLPPSAAAPQYRHARPPTANRPRARLATPTLALLALAAFLTALPAQAAKTTTHYHLDALGSPVAATNAQGQVIWRQDYSPHGERLNPDPAADTNPRGYTGHSHDDDTALIYMGARYYDPALGRFLGIDPAPYSPGNLHSFNGYAYGNNNPYLYLDPDGAESLDYLKGYYNAGFDIAEPYLKLNPAVGQILNATGGIPRIPYVDEADGKIGYYASHAGFLVAGVRGGCYEIAG